jgi:predicted transcriptional regulator
MDSDSADADDFIHLAAEVAAAYVANNSLPASDLPELLKSIHQSLRHLAGAEAGAALAGASHQQKPAVPVSETVYPDHIVCLEDGHAFRSLKRHLGKAHQMTPQEYRMKWDLPSDYPMVAPDYAAARSKMAKKIGLGQRRPQAKKA